MINFQDDRSRNHIPSSFTQTPAHSTCSTVLSTITWAPTSPRVPRFDEEVFYTPSSTTNSTDAAFSLSWGHDHPSCPLPSLEHPIVSLQTGPPGATQFPTSSSPIIYPFSGSLRSHSFSEVTLQTRSHLFEWAPSPPRCDSPFNSISSSLVLRCHGEFRAVV